MAYTLSTLVPLGLSYVGLTDLRAQLVDTSVPPVNVGTEISAGIGDLGGGQYLFTYAAFPDGFRGAVKFYRSVGSAASPLCSVAINPQEAENTDVKTSVGATGGATAANQTTIINATTAAAIRADLGLGSANLDTQLAAIAGYIDTEVATANTNISALIATVGVAGLGLSAIPKTGFKLASDGLDAVLIEVGISAGPNLTDDSGTQLTSINARQAQAAILSACAAVLAGAATTTVTMKQAAKPAGNTRITATVDADGNRTAIALKVPT
jgi:hypothetical protein